MALKEYYPTQELASILGVSRQAVSQRAVSEQWQSRPRKGRGGGHEWLLSSMPEVTSTVLIPASMPHWISEFR